MTITYRLEKGFALTFAEGDQNFRDLANSVSISVKAAPYNAVGDGVTDDTAAIRAALDVLNVAGGGVLYFPAGTYLSSSPLVWPQKVIGQGAGAEVTTLTSAHAGDGIQSTWPINSSTAVHIALRDMTIKNTNGANTGGGFADVGGTFVTLHKVRVEGFKYNVIFDQTELADIDLCIFEQPLTGGVWLVNGADHTVGANTEFTNRISINRSQFNSSVGIAIIDDGGVSHTFEDNNYNGWVHHIRRAGGVGLRIDGGEMESATSANIVFTNLTYNSGSGVGQSTAVMIGGGLAIVPSTGNSCISITSIGQLGLGDLYFGNTSAIKVVGTVNAGSIVSWGAIRNAGGGATFDGLATSHYEVGLPENILVMNYAATFLKTSANAIGTTGSSTTALNLPAGTTAIAPLRIAHGSAPTSPVDGDIWTTSTGVFVRINGVSVGPLS